MLLKANDIRGFVKFCELIAEKAKKMATFGGLEPPLPA